MFTVTMGQVYRRSFAVGKSRPRFERRNTRDASQHDDASANHPSSTHAASTAASLGSVVAPPTARAITSHSPERVNDS